MTEGPRHIQELDSIGLMLKCANVPFFDENDEQNGEVDLTPEVVWSAMRYLQDNPKASIEDACNFGIDEWVK